MIGLFNAVSASVHMKRREYAILRAIYVTPVQMVKMVLTQSIFCAICSIVIGLGTGIYMAYTFYNGFGGKEEITQGFIIPWTDQWIVITIMLSAAIFISLPMAIKLARMPIVKSITSD